MNEIMRIHNITIDEDYYIKNLDDIKICYDRYLSCKVKLDNNINYFRSIVHILPSNMKLKHLLKEAKKLRKIKKILEDAIYRLEKTMETKDE